MQEIVTREDERPTAEKFVQEFEAMCAEGMLNELWFDGYMNEINATAEIHPITATEWNAPVVEFMFADSSILAVGHPLDKMFVWVEAVA